MPIIKLNQFLGMRPRQGTENLAPNEAVQCRNFDLEEGVLMPSNTVLKLTGSEQITVPSNTRTLYRFDKDNNGVWFAFPQAVEAVRGPIADDTNLRTYMTSSELAFNEPRYTTKSLITAQNGGQYPPAAPLVPNTRKLGLPVPPKPTAVQPAGEPPSGGVKIPTSYVVTYVSDMGEEGPTSEPSNTVERWDGAQVVLTGLSAIEGDYKLKYYRIYRAEISGVFQFVGEVEIYQEGSSGLPQGNEYVVPINTNQSSATGFDLKQYFEQSHSPAVAGDRVHFILGAGVIISGGSTVGVGAVMQPSVSANPATGTIDYHGATLTEDNAALKNVGWAEGVNVIVEFMPASRVHASGGRPAISTYGNGYEQGGGGAGLPTTANGGDVIGGDSTSYRHPLGPQYLVSRYEPLKGSDALYTESPITLINPVLWAGGGGGSTFSKGGDIGQDAGGLAGNAIKNNGLVTIQGAQDLKGRIVQGSLTAPVYSAGGVVTVFHDSIASEALGEAVPSTEWIAPNHKMQGLVSMPNGMMAGFWGKTVAFCEPYQPHAWPIRYRVNLPDDIQAMGVSAAGLIVATTGAPYLLAGTEPSSMQAVRLDVVGACIAKRSMVDMGAYVIYASHDGLIAVGGTDAQVITLTHITPKQWRLKYGHSDLIGVRWNNEYLGFVGNNYAFTFSQDIGFRDFSLDSPQSACVYRNEENGRIYLSMNDSGLSAQNLAPVGIWAEGSKINSTEQGFHSVYQTRNFDVPNTVKFTCGKVHAAWPFPLNPALKIVFGMYKPKLGAWDYFTVNLDGTNIHKPFRLPANEGYISLNLSIESKGFTINGIALATQMSELE